MTVCFYVVFFFICFFCVCDEIAPNFSHVNILFLEAFQYTDTNGTNGIDETDLVFLKGILNSPAVTQRFKVSINVNCLLFFFITNGLLVRES